MKIKEELSRLNMHRSLLVVMGSHHGIIYNFEDDEITKLEEIRIDTPEYSDNEGMFKRGGTKNFSYGSVLEPKKHKAQKEFSKEIAERVKDISIKDGIEEIYLYAPSYMKSLIDSDWANEIKKRIKETFYGNYVAESPVELTEKIKQHYDQEHQKVPHGEARAILEKVQ